MRMRNVEAHVLEDKMDEAVTHYINTHQSNEPVHIDTNGIPMTVQDDGAGRVTIMHQQTYTTQMCRQVSVTEQVGDGPWGEELLEGPIAAIVAHLQNSRHHPPPLHKVAQVRSDVDTSVILDGSMRYSGQTMEQQSEPIVVQLPPMQTLPPLQDMKRCAETDWFSDKNKKDDQSMLQGSSSPGLEQGPGASPAQHKQQNRKSLPHKKRISRKLKRNNGGSTPHQQEVVVINCSSAVPAPAEQILPDTFVTAPHHHISHEVRPMFICQICGDYYGEEQLKFYQHLKQHYEPHATIIIENPVPDLAMDKMTNNCIVDNVATLPDSIVELSLENTVPKTMYQPIDKHILYNSSDKTLTYNSNKVQYSMASMEKEASTSEKADLYDTLDKLELYNCGKCSKTFRKQKHCEAHMREAHSNTKLEDMGEFSEPEDLMAGIQVCVGEGEGYEQTLLPHLTVDNGHVHQDHTRTWYARGCSSGGGYCAVCAREGDAQPLKVLKEEVLQRIFDNENANFSHNMMQDHDVGEQDHEPDHDDHQQSHANGHNHNHDHNQQHNLDGHEHNDHSQEHNDHIHEHNDHIHEHNDHSHQHNDHIHQPNDHSHQPNDHNHDHNDHSHEHNNHIHEHSEYDHRHNDHSHDHSDHNEHSHGHNEHSQGHDEHSQGHAEHPQGHDEHSQVHDERSRGHNELSQEHNEHGQDHYVRGHGHGHSDHGRGHSEHSQEATIEQPLKQEIVQKDDRTERLEIRVQGKQFVCQKCSRVFVHRNSLLYHMLSHEGRQHSCRDCNKRFYTAGALKIHKRVHNDDRPYKCDACGREFRQWSDLQYHKISIHSEKKHFKCEFCGKEFARKYSLNVHVKIHTGEKNYKCDICTKTFRTSSYRQTHMKTHTGDRPYKCEQCDKSFRSGFDLRRHVLVHDKVRNRFEEYKPKLKDTKKTKMIDTKEEKVDLPPKKIKQIALASTAKPPTPVQKKVPKPKKPSKKGAPNITVQNRDGQFKATEYANNIEAYDTRPEYSKFKNVYSEDGGFKTQIVFKDEPSQRELATLRPMFRGGGSSLDVEPEKVTYKAENTDGKLHVFTVERGKEYSGSIVSNSQVLGDIRHLEREVAREVRSEITGEGIESGFLERLTALYNIPAV